MTNMPVAPTALAPYRWTMRALRGDISSCPAANGTVSRPAASGV